jgi:uncharacterized protein
MNDQEMRIYESSDLELRGKPGAGAILSGYPIKWNRRSQLLGWFYEQVLPGATSKTIAENDIKLTYNHGAMLARSIPSLDHFTLRLSEDDTGQRAEADLPDTATAREVGALIERGDIRGMSFRFKTVGEDESWWTKTEDGAPLRSMACIRQADVSVVDDPAYLDTEVQVEGSLRAMSMHLNRPLAEVRAAFESRSIDGLWTPQKPASEGGEQVTDGEADGSADAAPGYRDLMCARLRLLDRGIPAITIQGDK